ncbi:UNKNOWN [Stylonychia lemnae]|uniref:Uncharacterized protein n=1 Tax=Stylonychia lemnae TaxID=5949 RepID=A0A078ACR8_STYLE|nr:UNKNOWN [Stylonychia lemnae]|eukprot:CDW79661.1 UNKNOWN [Stylonychia lemnae]
MLFFYFFILIFKYIVDLHIQGCTQEHAKETLQKTINLRATSSFSQAFAILFYQIFLDHKLPIRSALQRQAQIDPNEDQETQEGQQCLGNKLQEKEGTQKTMIFLLKGVERLFEDDVKNENYTFKVVYNQLKLFIFKSRFFQDSAACQKLFEEFMMVFCKYFLYYYEDSFDSNIETSRQNYIQNQDCHLFEKILKDIYKLSDIYQKFYEHTLTEEERAQKEIEYSYIMLHIYRNHNSQYFDDELSSQSSGVEDELDQTVLTNNQNQENDQDEQDEISSLQNNKKDNNTDDIKRKELRFQSRIIFIDILISETLKLMRFMQQSDSLLKIMKKFILLKDLPYMSKVTQNKILNTFNDFSHPGGPYFSPRLIRQYSIKVMSIMFPEGKKARKLVHSFFRLLHPYYWSQSLAYHSLSYSKQTLSFIKMKFDNILYTIGCKKLQQQDADDDFKQE